MVRCVRAEALTKTSRRLNLKLVSKIYECLDLGLMNFLESG